LKIRERHKIYIERLSQLLSDFRWEVSEESGASKQASSFYMYLILREVIYR